MLWFQTNQVYKWTFYTVITLFFPFTSWQDIDWNCKIWDRNSFYINTNITDLNLLTALVQYKLKFIFYMVQLLNNNYFNYRNLINSAKNSFYCMAEWLQSLALHYTIFGSNPAFNIICRGPWQIFHANCSITQFKASQYFTNTQQVFVSALKSNNFHWVKWLALKNSKFVKVSPKNLDKLSKKPLWKYH